MMVWKRSINRKDVRQDKEKNIESKTGWFNSVYIKTFLFDPTFSESNQHFFQIEITRI